MGDAGGGHFGIDISDYESRYRFEDPMPVNPIFQETLIREETKVEKVICFSYGTLFLCENGDLYGCGSNRFIFMGGEFGDTCVPTKVRSNVLDIAEDCGHTFAVFKDGSVECCGSMNDIYPFSRS